MLFLINTSLNKKYETISSSDQLFSLFPVIFLVISSVSLAKTKFGLPDAADLDIFDETDTAVDEDVFLDLLEAHPDMCLTVRERISDEGRCYQCLKESTLSVYRPVSIQVLVC